MTGATHACRSGGDAVTTIDHKPQPSLVPEFCKGCGRCIAACNKDCISPGIEIHPLTGLVPVVLDLERCNHCGLCIDACPEPFGLRPEGEEAAFELLDPAMLGGPRPYDAPTPELRPDTTVALPERAPLVVKGTYASAVGAVLAGCRHVFGYPITPSTEGAELMAKVQPSLEGVFVQAVSEVATVNMMYGAGGAGKRCMTFTSSPGFSLMLEGISYMIGAEVPAVFVNIMRGGPGLGNIAPAQADIKLACRGLGHGNTHAIVLAPATPQEMLDTTMLSFELAFKYRNPVVILGDGYLGQMTGKVRLPDHMVVPGIPEWAVYGDHSHRGNLICSIDLLEIELEHRNERLDEKYAQMAAAEQRADLHHCDDVDVVLIACNTPAQSAKGAVKELRDEGLRVGLFRPITLWPFPIDALLGAIDGARHIVVVEASEGQLEDEVRLALSHAEVHAPPIRHVRRQGGILPSQAEIVDCVRNLEGVR
jgi:pyruvate/2-oxoacid:ferredoxin oxidoreductase alpha subunit/ferredoxin